MKLNAEVDRFWTVKKGSKITFSLDDKATETMLKGIQNFHKLPLTLEVSVDIDERKRQLAQISPEQRAKIYAIFKDIAAYSGDSEDGTKADMKREFIRLGHEELSLSNCSKDVAGDFIEFLIRFCFENGVALKDHPREAFDDIEVYLRLCIEKKVCCICGKPAVEHHMTGSRIGMGRDRREVDDSAARKISLCGVHHSEIHTMPEEEFLERYHLL